MFISELRPFLKIVVGFLISIAQNHGLLPKEVSEELIELILDGIGYMMAGALAFSGAMDLIKKHRNKIPKGSTVQNAVIVDPPPHVVTVDEPVLVTQNSESLPDPVFTEKPLTGRGE
jgi:hypothetical protein